MAISLVTRPITWSRLWDTNRMTYTFSSTNAAVKPNFQFQFVLTKWNIDGTSTALGTFNLYPLTGGTCEFNPSTIYRNYISYDYNASNTGLEECENGAAKFSLSVYEYYGTPPVRSAVANEKWTQEVGGGTYGPLMCYNGVQQNIPYDYIPLNASGNNKWVMSSGTTKGDFLTDATEYRMSNSDLGFLYFNCSSPSRPIKIRYQIFYTCYGYKIIDPDNIALVLGVDKALNQPSYSQSLTQSEPYINMNDGGGVEPVGTPWTGTCSTYIYDTNVSYTYANSLQFRFPMGPYQLFNYGIITGYTNTWQYYKIDLMYGTGSTQTINRTPFIVWNTCKSDKYGKWSLSWLNPHGGFDSYTFDRKTDINYKLKKTTYQQKLQVNPGFSTYDAGERVFNTEINQEITLKSNLLTQKEAQLLIQLTQSPRVYVNTIYDYNGAHYPYGVPYIIQTDSIKYENKKNDKEIEMEIKIRPANQAITQND